LARNNAGPQRAVEIEIGTNAYYMGLLTNYMAQGVGKLAVFLHQANVKFPVKSWRSGAGVSSD